MSKHWMACPRCNSAKTRYNGSRIGRFFSTLILFFILSFFAASYASMPGQYVVIIPLFWAIILTISKDYGCKDCKFTWNKKDKEKEILKATS